MRNYRAYVMYESGNVVVCEGAAEKMADYRKTLMLPDTAKVLDVVEVVPPKTRKQHACRVTYVQMLLGEDGKYYLDRQTVEVIGTNGTGKSANSNIRYLARKCGHEIPSDAKIETVETIS